MDQKLLSPLKILLASVVAFIVILTSFLVGYSFGSKGKVSTLLTGKPSQDTFAAGWEAARKKLEESGLVRAEPTEIFTISGTITSINENKITLKANPTVINPLAEQAPEIRTITVTSETKIMKLNPKTPEEITKESEEFRKAMTALKPGATPPTPPSPYEEDEIEITDLKVGDTVSVTSEANIKMAAEFVAKEISLTVTPER